ncbi:hypothetical protein [Pseudomonas sp. NFACC46-3]|uniref:hypothetical protein n=1 Tax=Pseudomonas sp. NFACC46-3 TaxID=1566200 RepID=UPI0008F43A93|nr:hypothetical protein [Pseudomonas sp. NFACC46-3]SFL55760.1 hypothetical protein SAMN03159307_03203 [Pseudomonas sp. NFACC46-3]
MIFSGNSKIDLSSEELVSFVQHGSIGQDWKSPAENIPDYHPSTIKPFELGTAIASADVPWTVVQYWTLLDKGQEINKFTISTTASKKILITTAVLLYIKNDISEEVKSRIERAFSSYTFAEGDVDRYADKFLKLNPDISPFSFGCSRCYTVKILTDRRLDQNKENSMRQRLREDYILKLMKEEAKRSHLKPVPTPNELACPKDNAGSKQKTSFSEETAQPISNSELESKRGARIKRVCDPIEDAVDEMGKNQERIGCNDNKITAWQVARSDALPATRWEWDWHTVKIGCVSFDLYYPEFQLRDQEYHLIAAISVPNSIINYEKSIRNCAENSALAAVVLAVIFTDVATGLISFKALFWVCIKDKFVDSLPCVNAEVYVETVYVGDWH